MSRENAANLNPSNQRQCSHLAASRLLLAGTNSPLFRRSSCAALAYNHVGAGLAQGRARNHKGRLVDMDLVKTIRQGSRWGMGFALLFWGVMATSPLSAQGTTATVLGNVTDVSGAAIPEAAVQVKNLDTGAIQSTVSD